MIKVLICIIQKYLKSLVFFGRRVACAQTTFFRSSKNAGTILYMLCFEGGLVSSKWRICSSNKNVPENRKKGFYTSRMLKNGGIRVILYLAAKIFELG